MTTGEIVEELIYIKDHATLPRRSIEAIEEACNRLDRLPNTRIPAPDKQDEDKHLICTLLSVMLKATKNASDLMSLTFDEDAEFVTARFTGGGIRKINVAADSGVAMIRDIMKHLGV